MIKDIRVKKNMPVTDEALDEDVLNSAVYVYLSTLLFDMSTCLLRENDLLIPAGSKLPAYT